MRTKSEKISLCVAFNSFDECAHERIYLSFLSGKTQ